MVKSPGWSSVGQKKTIIKPSFKLHMSGSCTSFYQDWIFVYSQLFETIYLQQIRPDKKSILIGWAPFYKSVYIAEAACSRAQA